MSWYVAESLEVFRRELNALFPNRDKTSDGGIGDASHQAKNTSDHNPDYNRGGVVRARDFDKDGIPAERIVTFLIARGRAGDPRLGTGAYVIWNGRIWTARNGWAAQTYTGSNPHDKHFHLSICLDDRHYNSTAPWRLKEYLYPPATTTEDEDMFIIECTDAPKVPRLVEAGKSIRKLEPPALVNAYKSAGVRVARLPEAAYDAIVADRR